MFSHFLIGFIDLLVFPSTIVDNRCLAVIRHENPGDTAKVFVHMDRCIDPWLLLHIQKCFHVCILAVSHYTNKDVCFNDFAGIRIGDCCRITCPTPIYIKDNSDFYDILSPNSDRSYFYQQNLVEYAKKCEKQGSGYRNSTPDWYLYYQGTIVVPISIANKRLNKKKSCYDVLAFLCIDSMSTEAFLKSEESYNINIARAVAAQMYIMLSQYRQYLKNWQR